MSAKRVLAPLLLSVLAFSGCGISSSQRAPECGSVRDALIIEAQSVPTATMLPCVKTLPLGWGMETIDVKDGRTSIFLDSDRAGMRAVEISLSRTCDTSGATERRSDEPGARLYERVAPLVENRYWGERYYVFMGGCVTYRFRFQAEHAAVLANEVALGLGLIDRAEVKAEVKKIGFDL